MERLTHERCNGIKTGYWSTNKKQELIDMLGAYEDTGLTPPEVATLNERDTAKKPVQTEEGMVCPTCGSKAVPWSRFCDECGQRWWEE